MNCPRCRQQNPPHAKLCLECGASLRSGGAPAASIADLQAENERLRRSLTEAIDKATEASEQQTATSEILRAISRSQVDVQAVFDAIVESAVRLLRGFVAAISRLADDDLPPGRVHAYGSRRGRCREVWVPTAARI